MKRVWLAIVATLGATACDALSGLDDFAIQPMGTGAAGAGGSTATTGPGGAGGSGGSGGSAAGGAQGECPFDRFDETRIDPQLWVPKSSPDAYFIEQAGQLYLDVAVTQGVDRFARVDSATTLSLTSCPLVLEVFPGTVGDELDEALYFQTFHDVQNTAGFALAAGVLNAGMYDGGVPSGGSWTYDPQVHRWWRISAAAGVVSLDVSPDGVGWTNLFQTAPLFSLDGLWVVIAGGAGVTSQAEGGTVLFDNYNAAP
jgi:hypothetical protein